MPELPDPHQFVITRKRKKYKFAKFALAENCFEAAEWVKRSIDVIEIGAGNGLFSLELAKRYPDKTFAAIDVKADRLQHGAYAALTQGITNVWFIRARADQIDTLFPAHSAEAVWVTFADPYPKKRSAGRRITHQTYLKKYAALLVAHDKPTTRNLPVAALYIKHDNLDFFSWTLEQLVADKWVIDELSFDLHGSALSDDYKIYTTYEQKWLTENRTIYFARARQ
ncbi:MAG: methyltransferase domain-containing protein [Candidatus Saccharimonas sp.]